MISFSVSAKTITVDDNREEFQNADFTSIQEAVDYASEGDTILVYPGFYPSLQVEKKLILKGIGKPKPTISANGTGSTVTINAEGVVLENFFVTGSGSWPEAGIKIFSRNNTLKNNTISGNGYYGVLLYYSSENNTLENNEIKNNYYGIAAYYSKNNSVVSNKIEDNFYGIAFYSKCDFSRILGNEVHRNSYGIFLESSSYNRVADNNMSMNDFNFGVWGDSYSDFQNYIEKSNYADGKPVIYLINSSGEVISDASTVYLIKCTNITIENLEMKNNTNGVFLFQTNNTIVKGNIIRGSWYGIRLQDGCFNNLILGNLIENCDFGIHVHSSSENSFYLNSVLENKKNVYSYNSNNFWNSSSKLRYVYNTTEFTGYLGNYWGDYLGKDIDGDGIGEEAYEIDSCFDENPLVKPAASFIIFSDRKEEKEETKILDSEIRNIHSSGSRGSAVMTPSEMPETPEEAKKQNVSTTIPQHRKETIRQISGNEEPPKVSPEKEAKITYRSDENQTAIFGIVTAVIALLSFVIYFLRRK